MSIVVCHGYTSIMRRVTPDIPVAWTGRAILHADLDAFFAAVEQLDHPEWRGLPVIVGGDAKGRGVVSTASYEARRFGVHSAMASARAAQLCPNAIWAPPRFARYRELSNAVFEIFRYASPRVQPVSVDEAFIDVTPGAYSSEDPLEIARLIKSRVAELGITVSVGLASSKTVAKIASDFEKPDGLTVVRPGTERAFLAPLPVRTMSGIGPQTAKRLESLGIRTLGDLAALDAQTASDVLGSRASTLVERARGIDPRDVHPNDPAKSVSNERTFGEDVRTVEEVDGALQRLTQKVCGRLRSKGLSGRTVTVKLRFADFTTRTAQRTLNTATDDDGVVLETARGLIRESWSAGVGLRLLGVGVSGFDTHTEQLALMDTEDACAPRRPRALVKGIDEVRARFGSDALLSGRDLARHAPEQDTDQPPEPEADPERHNR